MHRGDITANDLRFSYLEAGEGPLVLLLHGFPDNACTWERQMPVLAGSRLPGRGTVPTRVLCGSRDMRKEMLPQQSDLFAGTYEWNLVEGAGHFLHREKPEEVNRLILDWLGRNTVVADG